MFGNSRRQQKSMADVQAGPRGNTQELSNAGPAGQLRPRGTLHATQYLSTNSEMFGLFTGSKSQLQMCKHSRAVVRGSQAALSSPAPWNLSCYTIFCEVTRKCSEIVADSKSQLQVCKQDHAVTRGSRLVPGRPSNSGPVEPYMQHNIFRSANFPLWPVQQHHTTTSHTPSSTS